MPSDLARLSPHDLVGLAQAGWTLGARHCVDCGGYHRIWGTLRAAGMVGGLTADAPELSRRLADALAPGARVLIAGSADGGLLDLVVRAGAGLTLDVLVVDRCATPLAVIESMEPYAQVTVRTRQVDLTAFEGPDRWDVIVSHSMLPHVGAAERIEVLRRLRAALAPGGRLILVARTFEPATDKAVADYPELWVRQTLDKIDVAGIPFPAPRDAFEALLWPHARTRSKPPWDLETGEAIADLLIEGGFEVLEMAEIQSEPTGNAPVKRARRKRSYIFVAG